MSEHNDTKESPQEPANTAKEPTASTNAEPTQFKQGWEKFSGATKQNWGKFTAGTKEAAHKTQ